MAWDWLGIPDAIQKTFSPGLSGYTEDEKEHYAELGDALRAKQEMERRRKNAWEQMKNMTGQQKENNIIGIFVILIGGLLALSLFQK